jgi:hypothetical protein
MNNRHKGHAGLQTETISRRSVTLENALNHTTQPTAPSVFASILFLRHTRMPNLHIVLCIETTTHVLPDYTISVTTMPQGYKVATAWDRGSYTKSEALDLTNDMIHTIWADVENLLHAPPYVVLKKTTFDLVEANDCYEGCKRRLPVDGMLRDYENGTIGHVNKVDTKWTWLVRTAVDAPVVRDSGTRKRFDGRDFSDAESEEE